MHKEPQRRYQSVEALARDIDHYLKGEPLDAQSALERRRSVFGQDSKQVAESLFHLGALRGDQDCLPDAERLIRRALAIDQRHLPADHPSLAETKRALGQILERRGDYQGAIDVLQQAVRFHSRKGDSNVDYLASLNLLANAHFYLGHYAVSDSLNQKVLAIDKQIANLALPPATFRQRKTVHRSFGCGVLAHPRLFLGCRSAHPRAC